MFNEQYELFFLFSENYFGKPECLVCQRVLSRMNKCDMQRHYYALHNEYEDIIGDAREALIIRLKKTFYEKYIADSGKLSSEETTELYLKRKASFIVATSLAKRCRPLEDGEFFKELCNDVLQCFGEKAEEVRKIVNDIPLSSRTIARRTETISEFIFSNVKKRILNCKFFSICLDECTDLNDIAQLIICVRSVNEHFDVHEEMFNLYGLHNSVKGKFIFDIVNENVLSFTDKNKFCSVCTDGANVMVGRKGGFVGHLLKTNLNIFVFHCIIHQQALFSKSLNVMNTMKIVVTIVNKIRGGHNALTHRKFKDFLDGVHAEYGDLVLHTEIRWLSKGRCLERLFSLRKEVVTFLDDNITPETKLLSDHLKDKAFLLDFAFLTDVIEFVNQLNIQLQGRGKTVFELFSAIKQFIRKTEILIENLKNKNLLTLKRTFIIYSEDLNGNVELSGYVNVLQSLLDNYNERFHDFKKIEHLIEMHNNPMLCSIEQQRHDLKDELIKMREDLDLPLSNGIEFWRNISADTYPKMKNEMLKLYSMFGSTYICEATFSTLKHVQSKARNRLTDKHLENLLRIKSCPYQINIEDAMQFQ